MADLSENSSAPEGPAQAISQGRRHLLVRDYFNAVTSLAQGCGMLAELHGDTSDELAEPYLLYGRALLGLSREEQGVLGTGVPGQDEAEDEEEPEEGNAEAEAAPAEEKKEEKKDKEESKEVEKTETKDENKEEKVEEKTEEKSEEKAEEKTEEKSDEKVEEKAEDKVEEKTEDKEAEKLTNGEASASTSVLQNGDAHENGDAEEEEEDGDDIENEDDDDASSNLQLAWEVLEIAKLILCKRGEAGHKLLAEAHRLLGEVSMESGNQISALADLNACLELLRQIEPADARSIAETHYQLGLAYGMGNEFDSSIEQFKEATSLLEMRIKELEAIADPPKSDDPFYSVESEIKELKELLPEIREKITDMRDFKAQACKQLLEGIKSHVSGGSCSNGAGPSGAGSSSSSSGASSSSAQPTASPKDVKPASDISHLVRKKRKNEDGSEVETAASPCKKPTIVSPGKSA